MFTSTHCNRLITSYRLYGKLLKFLLFQVTAMYFKDRKWISKTVYCISCSIVCKIIFCSEFPDIPDKASKKRRRKRRTQAIAKRYAFHANAIIKYPTCITCRNTSLIDYILASILSRISQHGLINVNISDHQLIYCTRTITKIKTGGVH